MDLDAETRWLITHQYGLLSRAQARAAGRTPDELRRAARRWRTVLPGVWLVTDRPRATEPNRVHRELAGLLYAGSGSMLFGFNVTVVLAPALVGMTVAVVLGLVRTLKA